MPQTKAKIIYNKKIRNNYFRCAIIARKIARTAYPGQFLSIKVSDREEPLLRRPFSIHRVNGQAIEIFYQVVGDGSRLLSAKKPGELLDVIGPLGDGFNLPPATDGFEPVLVAGGMGVAPLLFVAEKLKSCRPLVFIGAKRKEDLFCLKEFTDLGCQVRVATDDGSRGFKGKVTGLLRQFLSSEESEQAVIYACGPRPMLEAVSSLVREHEVPAEISLEEHMACGIGACLGCVVNTREGYKRVCKEGPVFNADEVVWR